ncbi:MAG TPA: LD-carboxypeptidase [Phycisphaerae bacterium]|nr:LD-carboxypeptidase [Phycisphaerales bacterium]HRX87580.1 LD-carboxypeptidase [Phycisphaerae bacterium]
MTKPIIHVCAPASPASSVLETVGVADARELIARVQDAVGRDFRVTGKAALLDPPFDEHRGGRRDDAARVRELHAAFANDDVVALVAARGGGWMARILPDLDFSILDRRRRPLAVFGFSELTPLVNLVGRRRMGRGYYFMTPGFPKSGAERHARLNARKLLPSRPPKGKALESFAKRWAAARFAHDFADYFRDVTAILRGAPPQRAVSGRLVRGGLAAEAKVTLVGGCLSLVTPLTAGPYARLADPKGKWLVLEDLEEYPYRIDRQFAHLKLAGWFERCSGVLLGDFHMGDEDQRADTLAILDFHLRRTRDIPVVTTADVGHIWPQAVLPVGKRMTVRCETRKRGPSRVTFAPPWAKWRCV